MMPGNSELSYATAAAMAAALTDRIRNAVAAGSPFTVTQLRRQYAYDRLLARLFTAEPDRWVLKGGGNLLARLPLARHSRDLDLYCRRAPDIDAAVEALQSAATTDLVDHFVFDADQPRPLEVAGVRAGRVPIEAMLGARLFERFTVDLVTEDTMTDRPTAVGPLAPILIDGLATPTFRGYPIVDHLADKLCAIVERHGPAAAFPSSRYRDLVDIVLIATSQEVSGPKLRAAIRSHLLHRRLPTPARFDVPDLAAWERGYATEAKRLSPHLAHRTLTEALDLSSAFFDPVLAGQELSLWDPKTTAWH